MQIKFLRFKYNDGGRKEAGFKGKTGDCSCRAIAIVTGLPYIKVYNDLNELGKKEYISKHNPKKGSAREGVKTSTLKKYLSSLGYIWIPTMLVGKGCKFHLRKGEVPNGRIICRLSKHLTAVIDGTINDTYNPSRDGFRCIYGFWIHGDYLSKLGKDYLSKIGKEGFK